MGHSLFSPSAAHRWMSCPASLVGEQINETSRAAAEGSAAHELASLALTADADAAAYFGRVLVDWPAWPVTLEMAEYVQVYIDYVRQHTVDGDVVLIEEKLPHGDALGLPGETGTGDAVIISPSRRTAKLIDLKFGKNPKGKVIAAGNKQLRCYMLGVMELCEILGYDIQWYEGHIVQPRLEWIDDERIEVNELVQWRAEAFNAVTKAQTAIEFYDKHSTLHDKYYNPGDDQCRFCPRKAFCPALQNELEKAYAADFEVITDCLDKPAQETSSTLDLDRLAYLYSKLDLWGDYIKAVGTVVHDLMMQGHQVPGLKVVAGQRGKRAWKNASDAHAYLQSVKGVDKKKLVKESFIGITDAQKLLATKKPKVWEELQRYIHQPLGQPRVVKATAPGVALDMSPESDFQAMDDQPADDDEDIL